MGCPLTLNKKKKNSVIQFLDLSQAFVILYYSINFRKILQVIAHKSSLRCQLSRIGFSYLVFLCKYANYCNNCNRTE